MQICLPRQGCRFSSKHYSEAQFFRELKLAEQKLLQEYEALDKAQVTHEIGVKIKSILKLGGWQYYAKYEKPYYALYKHLKQAVNDASNRKELMVAGVRHHKVFSVGSQALAKLTEKDLLMAVGKLEDIFREPFQLCVIEGYKVREVAKLLGLPDGTIKSRLRLARKKLKKLLPKR